MTRGHSIRLIFQASPTRAKLNRRGSPSGPPTATRQQDGTWRFGPETNTEDDAFWGLAGSTGFYAGRFAGFTYEIEVTFED